MSNSNWLKVAMQAALAFIKWLSGGTHFRTVADSDFAWILVPPTRDS